MSDVRSGSTLLENILSKSPEMVSVGELRLLYSYLNKGRLGRTLKWKCSCGLEFINCTFWAPILNHIYTNYEFNLTQDTIIKDELAKNKVTKFFNYKPTWVYENNKSTIAYLDCLYDNVFKKSKKNTIIDSSKDPVQALALYQKSRFNVKIVFLKRDIRSVVLSKRKWNKGKKKSIYHTLWGSKLYDLRSRNVFKNIDKKDRIYITYEDLAKSPQRSINNILEKFNLTSFDVPEYMYIENDHTIAGTPNKMKKRKIKYDTKWETKLNNKKVFSLISKLIDVN